MGEYAKVLGTPEKFTHKGQEYELAALHAEIQAQFEGWLQRNALEGLARHKAVLSEADYRMQLNQIFLDIAAGAYSFMSVASYAANKTYDGQKELLYLRLRYCQPQITRDEAEEIFNDKLDELIQLAKAMDSDPKSKASPETSATSTPETPCPSPTSPPSLPTSPSA